MVVNKELSLTTVDPHHAQTIGLSAERIRYLLLVMLALAIVAGIQSVGVVMTTALMVTPAAAASLITRQLRWMFVWSGILSVLSNCIGLSGANPPSFPHATTPRQAAFAHAGQLNDELQRSAEPLWPPTREQSVTVSVVDETTSSPWQDFLRRPLCHLLIPRC